MNRSLRISALAAAALAVPAIALTGCGDSGTPAASTTATTTPATSNASLSAADLLAAATDAVTAASSVHIEGKAATPSATEAAQLSLTATRSDQGEGTVLINGATLNVLVAGGTPYIKAPTAFWAGSGAPTAVAKQLADTWITAPESGSTAGQLTGITQFVDMTKVVDPILAEFGTPTKSGTGSTDGTPTITLKDAKGNVLYVPASGTPLPVRYVSNAKGKAGDVRYSKWSAPVSVSAPADAIDLGTVTGSG